MTSRISLIAALLLCTSCASRTEQVIRHLVIAELAQSRAGDPSFIEVTSVKIRNGNEATATAELAPSATRGTERQKVQCELARTQERWHVTSCAPPG
jgi:hypothetical protein